jgi:hypothetical protein
VIVGLCMVRDDADVIGATMRHLLEQGVDRMLVEVGPSVDGTCDVVDEVAREAGEGVVTVYDDPDPVNRQVMVMNRLLGRAVEEGATWAIPWDADEWIYATGGGTVREALSVLAPDVDKLYLRHYQHVDWNSRHVEPNRLRKVVFRARPGQHLVVGNHEVTSSGAGIEGVLDLRELCYRSYDHWKAKFRARNANLDPVVAADPTAGLHHRRLAGLSEEELEVEWKALQDTPSVQDPIPSRFRPGSRPPTEAQ